MEELFQTRNSEILEFRRKQRERIVKDTEEAWESEDPKEKFRTSEFRDSKTQDKKKTTTQTRKEKKNERKQSGAEGGPQLEKRKVEVRYEGHDRMQNSKSIERFINNETTREKYTLLHRIGHN